MGEYGMLAPNELDLTFGFQSTVQIFVQIMSVWSFQYTHITDLQLSEHCNKWLVCHIMLCQTCMNLDSSCA